MVDLDVFRLRLAKLREVVRHLAGLAETDRATLLADDGLLAQLERWMHLAVEASIDLAQHLIASEGWPTPATNREAFQLLGRKGVLPPALADQMEGWAGLRNILVHLYLQVDHELLYTILTEELGQLEEFAAVLARRLDAES